jgi:uncharacterized protein YjiK
MGRLKFQTGYTGVVLLFGLVLTGCKQKATVLKSPPHYDFSKPTVGKLDRKILEISGIVWDSKNNEFIAHNDETGTLFYLDRDRWEIKPNGIIRYNNELGDYEDIAIANNSTYILRSDGLLQQIVRDSAGKADALGRGSVPLSGDNDFESLYYDESRKALIVLCKNCSTDSKKMISAFAYYFDSIGFVPKPVFQIDAEEVAKLSPRKTAKLQPSAAAIHPVLKKLFIISAATNQLVIADLNGKVEGVYILSKKLFPQPEGITFKKNGEMYISNEGIGSREATIVKFVFDTVGTRGKGGATSYDLTLFSQKMELDDKLHEISGMAYLPGTETMLAENDEKGTIYTVDFKNKTIEPNKMKFGGKGDYEDIVHTDSIEYLLVSTGSVVEVKMGKDSVDTQEFNLGIPGTNEFEAMYLDSAKKGLILLCKQCDHEKDKIRAAYRYDLKTKTFSDSVVYEIDIAAIQTLLNDDKAEFKPSAAAINPMTHKLFIVASVGKVLVIASLDGKVEQVFKLDPQLFNQPEGLTFAPNGDLYISNEGGTGIATILKFDYKKK